MELAEGVWQPAPVGQVMEPVEFSPQQAVGWCPWGPLRLWWAGGPPVATGVGVSALWRLQPGMVEGCCDPGGCCNVQQLVDFVAVVFLSTAARRPDGGDVIASFALRPLCVAIAGACRRPAPLIASVLLSPLR